MYSLANKAILPLLLEGKRYSLEAPPKCRKMAIGSSQMYLPAGLNCSLFSVSFVGCWAIYLNNSNFVMVSNFKLNQIHF